MDSMVNKPEVLAIIPARGGSKGIPRKNIRNFAGYPLIAFSIEAAKKAKSVSRVIVSTDDEEIAAVAREYGAETPFIRPAKYAQDQTTDLPVFQQALEWLKKNEDYEPDIVVQLRPTSPIRPIACVDEAVQKLIDHPEADSVRGVVAAKQNPFKMWRIDEKLGTMKPLLTVEGIPEAFNAPRQILPPVYWQTGHIDAIRTSTILEKGSMSGTTIVPLVIDPAFTVDIDSIFDWQQAEWLVMNGGLELVDLANQRRKLPEKIELLVMDFDGVLTDNRVWVDEEGHERIAASRSDSFGLSLLRRKTNIQALVLSRETNPVVAARCEKLDLPFLQGIKEKDVALKAVAAAKKINLENIIYMGNDVNDLPCFPLVACAIAPADAEKEILRAADIILTKYGGHGAVRELCDMLLSHHSNCDVCQ
jgi:N-acylneuraminate cytidylyltransferase